MHFGVVCSLTHHCTVMLKFEFFVSQNVFCTYAYEVDCCYTASYYYLALPLGCQAFLSYNALLSVADLKCIDNVCVCGLQVKSRSIKCTYE